VERGARLVAQYYGGSRLDASLLLLPQVGFLPPEDHRVHGTLTAVQAQLSSDGFIARGSGAVRASVRRA
jgi:GH15 family glucan-1,4-alpha-glucosidase